MRSMRNALGLMLALLILISGCSQGAPDRPRDGGPDEAEVSLEVLSARIPQSEFDTFEDSPDNGGRWQITFEDDIYVVSGPRFQISEAYAIVGTELRITADPAPAGAFNCYIDDVRTTEEGQASATYAITESGEGVTFEATKEPCPFRALILEREWLRGSG